MRILILMPPARRLFNRFPQILNMLLIRRPRRSLLLTCPPSLFTSASRLPRPARIFAASRSTHLPLRRWRILNHSTTRRDADHELVVFRYSLTFGSQRLRLLPSNPH